MNKYEVLITFKSGRCTDWIKINSDLDKPYKVLEEIRTFDYLNDINGESILIDFENVDYCRVRKELLRFESSKNEKPLWRW